MNLADLYELENKTTVRVTYRDTDQMGYVYYANHLVWFEIGRTELIRQMGLSYVNMEESGVFLPVVSAHVDYRSPARYDDLVEIHTRVAKLSHVAITFDYRLTRSEDDNEVLIATGTTRHGFIGKDGKILEKGHEILGIVS